MKRALGLYVAWLVATVILVLAVTGRHPYGFYTLLRWICCAAFAFSAFVASEKNRVPWVWIFGVLAMLFNPIVPLPFKRDTWQMIDWVTIGVIVVASVAFWPPGMFSRQFHFKISSSKNNALYDAVASELQAKTMVPGLWAKAFAEAGGQIDRARALYIKYRVAQLAHEASEHMRQEQRAAREAAKQQAATDRVKQRGVTEAATQQAMSGRQNFAYGVSAGLFGALTLVSGLLTLAGVSFAFANQTGQVPDSARVDSIIGGVVMAAVFGSLTALWAWLTWKCFKAAKSVTPPPPASSRPA
jgi:Family of unknown function (DUF6804)